MTTKIVQYIDLFNKNNKMLKINYAKTNPGVYLCSLLYNNIFISEKEVTSITELKVFIKNNT